MRMLSGLCKRSSMRFGLDESYKNGNTNVTLPIYTLERRDTIEKGKNITSKRQSVFDTHFPVCLIIVKISGKDP